MLASYIPAGPPGGLLRHDPVSSSSSEDGDSTPQGSPRSYRSDNSSVDGDDDALDDGGALGGYDSDRDSLGSIDSSGRPLHDPAYARTAYGILFDLYAHHRGRGPFPSRASLTATSIHTCCACRIPL